MLDGISFIGIDEKTDLDKLNRVAELSNTPEIEFGVLYSESKMAQAHKRYPSKKWIENFVQKFWSGMPLYSTSLHLCGSAIEKYLDKDQYLVDLVNQFDRVQLNFSMAKFKPDELTEKLFALQKVVDSVTVLQFNKSKAAFIQEFTQQVKTPSRLLYNILFDGSGGFGRVLEEPQKPIDGFYCGYAGGIGPETVLDIVTKIDKVVSDEYYYIDMESKIREDDYLSIDKCIEVVKIVNQYLEDQESL